jgi:hypothetical protein
LVLESGSNRDKSIFAQEGKEIVHRNTFQQPVRDLPG